MTDFTLMLWIWDTLIITPSPAAKTEGDVCDMKVTDREDHFWVRVTIGATADVEWVGGY